jgi:hypothetical protein
VIVYMLDAILVFRFRFGKTDRNARFSTNYADDPRNDSRRLLTTPRRTTNVQLSFHYLSQFERSTVCGTNHRIDTNAWVLITPVNFKHLRSNF